MQRRFTLAHSRCGFGAAVAALIAGAALSCGNDGSPRGASAVRSLPSFSGIASCANLECEVATCPNGGTTTISGVAYSPSATDGDPLFDAIVYVPNTALDPFPAGVACDQCGALISGSPLVTARTDARGKFALKGVPAGVDIPLVIQMGRWRRQVTIPVVKPCEDTALPRELTRLPRNKREGDIPQYAISTGAADALECVLRKIGIDDAEFTASSGNGRVHIYPQNGAVLANAEPASTLWGDDATLAKYDMVIFDCEGGQFEKPTDAKDRLVRYTANGGRVFASHFSYVWLYDAAPFSGTAKWASDRQESAAYVYASIDTSFDRGAAFADWLNYVGAALPGDQMALEEPRFDTLQTYAPAQRWVYATQPNSVEEYTFDTPVGAPAAQQCGRVAFSDFHVTLDTVGPDVPFPTECSTGPLSPEEKSLEFMLFDLASCIHPPGQPGAVVTK